MSSVAEELSEVKKRYEKQSAHFKELQKERTFFAEILISIFAGRHLILPSAFAFLFEICLRL